MLERDLAIAEKCQGKWALIRNVLNTSGVFAQRLKPEFTFRRHWNKNGKFIHAYSRQILNS